MCPSRSCWTTTPRTVHLWLCGLGVMGDPVQQHLKGPSTPYLMPIYLRQKKSTWSPPPPSPYKWPIWNETKLTNLRSARVLLMRGHAIFLWRGRRNILFGNREVLWPDYSKRTKGINEAPCNFPWLLWWPQASSHPWSRRDRCEKKNIWKLRYAFKIQSMHLRHIV